jgi:hypothetical protein
VVTPPVGRSAGLSRRALLAAGALAGAGVLLGGCGEAEPEPARTGDARLLASLLEREHAVIAVLAPATVALPRADRRRARRLLAEDRRQAARLAGELAARGVRRPRRGQAPPAGASVALALARTQAALAGYAGAAARLGDGGLRRTVLGFAAVEAQHAAVLRLLLGDDPAPDAFAGLA